MTSGFFLLSFVIHFLLEHAEQTAHWMDRCSVKLAWFASSAGQYWSHAKWYMCHIMYKIKNHKIKWSVKSIAFFFFSIYIQHVLLHLYCTKYKCSPKMKFDSVKLYQVGLNLVPALISISFVHDTEVWIWSNVVCVCVWLSRDEPVSLPSGVMDSTLYANEVGLVLPN